MFKIIHHSIISASRQPRWWLFALLQATAFSAVGQLARPRMLHNPLSLLLIFAAIVLAPLTVWLWQNIAAETKETAKFKLTHAFIYQSLSGATLILSSVVIIISARLLYPFWPVHTLVFAVVASSAGLALLYLSLCAQTLSASLRLALDTWNKKISIAAAAAFVLILAHGISYTLAHGVFAGFYSIGMFSVFGHSATIWILLTVLMLAMAYFSAILNCFVVFLFLDSIARKKDPEAEKAKIMEPARAGVI